MRVNLKILQRGFLFLNYQMIFEFVFIRALNWKMLYEQFPTELDRPDYSFRQGAFFLVVQYQMHDRIPSRGGELSGDSFVGEDYHLPFRQ